MKGRKALVVAGVVALAVAGAVVAVAISAGPGVGPGAVRERTVRAELLLFEQGHGHGFPRVATVLRSRADARAVRGWFTGEGRDVPDPDDIERLAARRDYGREAVVLFSHAGGCDTARGARLTSDGPKRLSMALTGVTRHDECEAPYRTIAMFAVDKALAPADGLVLGGARAGTPDPVSPARLLAFAELPGPPPRAARAAEVTQPDQLDAFAGSLRAGPLVEHELRDLPEGVRGRRRFGFVLSGCGAESALMVIEAERLAAEPFGQAGGRDADAARCPSPEHYAAVFEIDAENVPPRARMG